MTSSSENPAFLADYDPEWATRGTCALDEVRERLGDLPGLGSALFDHIGSTSVPGLAAKPLIDLQVRVPSLPTPEQLSARLSPLGFEQAHGSRPDSPGVTHDLPRGDVAVADHVWQKRLYVAPTRSLILHVRRLDSPWGRYTVWFRDWLRAHPEERRRYELTKRDLSEQNEGKPDYDDYTRAKTAFFDGVQPVFTAWARSTSS